jgi:ribosomal protein S18 acetylase RimI-like enzyme
MSAPRVVAVEAAAIEAVLPRLCEILVDCVEGGASIGFVAPFGRDEAAEYWRGVQRAVSEGRCVLLVAASPEGEALGTVQLDIDTLPNQRHRAGVSKLLVHRSARGRGVGESLMAAAERVAADAGRWLLTLDTATDAARRLYERMGWSLGGAIPRYAQNPDHSFTDTWLYWKALDTAPPTGGAVSGRSKPGPV